MVQVSAPGSSDQTPRLMQAFPYPQRENRRRFRLVLRPSRLLEIIVGSM